MDDVNKTQIKTVKKVYPQIYSYTLPDEHSHDGWQKIGYTERKDVDERIREQTQTAAIKLNYNKLWNASAKFIGEAGDFFNDKQLHKFYVKNGITRSEKQENNGFGEEWFYFDGTPNRSKELFDKFVSHDFQDIQVGKVKYALRIEQEDAVLKTLEYAANHQTTDFGNPNKKAKFLWNAKPRFGKTLASYDFAKKFNAKNVLIVTNRPAIANSWYDDYEKFVDGYYFISTTDSLKERPSISRSDFLSRLNPSSDDKQITFLSLQDLKGGRIFGGSHDKLEWVADLNWDLLIIDEAHEGVDTERTDQAFERIKRRFTLHLSGTPFKAIADGYFAADQIFNWTYIDEQRAKENELNLGDDAGDHVNLPDMRLFTYKMSDMISTRLEEGMDLDEENIDYAFELNEMFATNSDGRFKYEQDIITFLNQLTTNTKYPFSTPELRNELKHTFWMVGNRVASTKAMEKLLRNHEVFKDYKIIVAAGDGKPQSDDDSSEEEMQNIKENEKAYDRVKKAIAENDKTITLSVGQLTTGVTIKEWSAVLMLSDIKSESLYMQAIFRSQNPYEFRDENGEMYRKKSAYVFDFSPNRVLRVYDKFANSLLAEAAQGEVTEKIREENVAELLNYFPVLAEDDSGEMVELDAEQVLTFPKAIIAKEVVNRGFVTNLLFVNINNVFNIPTEVISSLNKTFSTNDTGRVKNTEENVPHDPDRKTKKEHRISVNKEKLLGQKVYGTRMQELVANAAQTSIEDEVIEKVLEDYMDEAAEPFSKYKEIYSPSNKEFEEKQNEHFEKAREVVEEYVSKDLGIEKNQIELADKLSELIQNDLPNDLVVYEEEENYEKEEKNEMDKIREKLRTFTRAIPSFVMASKDVSRITIDNIEDTVTDEDFEALFTERDGEPFTKDDFRKIRGPWTNPETGEVFQGFFDKYTFNAAIREFEEKRREVADYLRPGIKEDIFSYIRPLKTNQIFTPRRVVNQMLDILEQENPGIFENPNLTFADLYVKSGLYLTEIAKRLNRGLENQIPDQNERIRHIFEKQLFGFAPTNIIYNIAHKFVYGIMEDFESDNLKQLDLTEPFKKGDTLGMKFDVIVGNPPYQDGNNQIYTLFYVNGIKIANILELIFPVGWQGTSVANLLSNLNNERIKRDSQIVMIDNKQNVFPKVPGAEWTNIIQWKKDYNNGLNGRQKLLTNGTNQVEILFPITKEDMEKPKEIESIVKKVDSFGGEKMVSSGSASKPYGFRADPLDNPDKYNLIARESYGETTVRLFGRKKGIGRTHIYVERNGLPKISPLLDKYKLFVVKAWGNMDEKKGFLGGSYSEILIAEPGDCCSEMYIEFGPYNNFDEAKNARKYFYTKFFRTVFYKNKTSQNTARDTYSHVPLQNFTESSDIDWSKSIPEIDQQLYKKYGLDEKEIAFIEEKIAPME